MRWLNAVRAQVARRRRGARRACRTCARCSTTCAWSRTRTSSRSCAARRASPPRRTAARCRRPRPGCNEYEIEAELLYEFRRSGAQFPAYSPIVAGGANACVLHYVANDAPLRDGDLLLIDAGCELDGYASDITRTFPVNGRFSGAQRERVRDRARRAGCGDRGGARRATAGTSRTTRRCACSRRACSTSAARAAALDEVLEKETYKRFYMHRTGHWLGLDVHDAGEYKRGGELAHARAGHGADGRAGPLHPRRPTTCRNALRNIGIRIEDDVAGHAQAAARCSPPKRPSASTTSKR